MKQFNHCVAFLTKLTKKNAMCRIQNISGRSTNQIFDPNNKDPQIISVTSLAKQRVEGGIYYPDQDRFVFKNGVEVHWKEAPDAVEKEDTNEATGLVSEKFKYTIGRSFEIQKDFIQIDNKFYTKLAVSIAISRSILLDDLESSFEKYLLATKNIPQMLMDGNFNKMKRNEIQQLIGQFMQLRYKLNLSNNPYVELAEFTWNDESSEKVMKESFRYFDIYARVATMNRKLDYASEISNLLKSNLTERHGFRLEWIIIVLIALEFALSLNQEWRYYHQKELSSKETLNK